MCLIVTDCFSVSGFIMETLITNTQRCQKHYCQRAIAAGTFLGPETSFSQGINNMLTALGNASIASSEKMEMSTLALAHC